MTSSLFGLVAPGDRIPAYRLSGDAVLPGLGTVAGVWRERARPGGPGGRPATGCSSTCAAAMYAAFWRPAADLARGSRPCGCCTRSTGRRQVVSHFNKATKGRIVRALLEDGATRGRRQAFAAALRDLGWVVEVGPASATGTPARRGRQRAVTQPGSRPR